MLPPPCFDVPLLFKNFLTLELLTCCSAMQALITLYWTPSLLKAPGLASSSGFCFIFVFAMVSPIVFGLVFIVDWEVFSIF